MTTNPTPLPVFLALTQFRSACISQHVLLKTAQTGHQSMLLHNTSSALQSDNTCSPTVSDYSSVFPLICLLL